MTRTSKDKPEADLTIRDVEGVTTTLTGTPEHPFFVPAAGDYVPMGQLAIGTALRRLDGRAATVVSVSVRHERATVYNFEVAGTHTYFVAASMGGAGVWVHNKCINERIRGVLNRYNGKLLPSGDLEFPTHRQARQAASELVGDLGPNPRTVRLSDYKGGPWQWKDSQTIIGRYRDVGGIPVSGWRDDFLGHVFPDGTRLGPHVNVWGEDFALHLFYPGGVP